jgi:hypothetical protein
MTEIDNRRAALWNLTRLGLIEPFDGVLECAKALVAVQAQEYPSCREAFSLRVNRLPEDTLDRELAAGGSLARIWTIRGTLHIIARDLLGIHVAATAAGWFQRHGRYMEKFRAGNTLAKTVYPRITAVLGDTPMSYSEITEAAGLGPEHERMLYHYLKEMCYLGLAVRGPQPGGRAVYLAACLAEPLPDPVQARAALTRDYLHTYGPATRQDIRYWSGFSTPEIDGALALLSAELSEVRLEGKPALMLTEDLESLLALDSGRQLSEILLPAFDVLLLAHRNKERFIDEAYRRRVFLKNGRFLPVVLQNGRVTGTWHKIDGRSSF